jgi:hypothetical protein
MSPEKKPGSEFLSHAKAQRKKINQGKRFLAQKFYLFEIWPIVF